jgi:hypothetical protein
LEELFPIALLQKEKCALLIPIPDWILGPKLHLFPIAEPLVSFIVWQKTDQVEKFSSYYRKVDYV